MPLIYCQLGDYVSPATQLREPDDSIDMFQNPGQYR